MVLKPPLYNVHKDLGATFTEFGGYEMPLQFSSIKEEHLAVRKNVGLFDVSHMCNVWVKGTEGNRLLAQTMVEDASRIEEGLGQYTVLLRESGMIIDDTIFLHLPNQQYMVIPNAGMDEIVTKWLTDKAQEYDIDAGVENVSRNFVILAIQGPKALQTLQKLTKTDLKTVKFFGCQYADVAGVECALSYTGYTGEHGFELQITPSKNAVDVFNQILEAGKEFDIKPVGLGARDTLRLEKCFILAGNEFKGGKTPLQANLSWLINWDHEFIGKQALLAQKEQGGYDRLTYLRCIERGVPRHGCEVQRDGKTVGHVSSGTMSPCLNIGIAMAYVHPEFRTVGDVLDIMIRGKAVKAIVIKPPFVPKDWAGGTV